MIPAYVKGLGATYLKTAGTSMSFLIADPTTAGNTIVARIVFDNAATASKPIVSSITKPAEETASWTLLGAARSTSTSAGAFASGELWAIQTTVDWPMSNLTLTLDSSVTMKAIRCDEFYGVLGMRSTTGTAYSTTTTAASATTTGTTPAINDLALGFIFGSNTASAQTGGGGTWSAVLGVGSTGASAATNNYGVGQHKVLTASGHQTYANSAAMTAGNGSIVAVLQANPAASNFTKNITDSVGMTDSVLAVLPSPKADTLIDSFDTRIDPAKWPNAYGTVVWESGRVAATERVQGYSGITTAIGGYDLENSYVSVKAVPPTVQTDSTETTMAIYNSSGDGAWFILFYDPLTWPAEPARICTRLTTGGVNSNRFAAYDPVEHAYIRVAHSGVGRGVGPGTVYWDASPDGINWTSIDIQSTNLDLSRVTIELSVGQWDAGEATQGTGYFDNVNYVPPSAPAGYAAAVMADSPLAYWRLGEAGGPTAADTSGLAHHGTYTGTPVYGTTGALTGDADTALTLSGDDYIQIPDHNDFDFMPASTFSIEFWFRTTTTNAYMSPISKITGFGGQYAGWEVHQYADDGTFDGQISPRLITDWGANNAVAVNTTASYSDGNWHHFVSTYNGNGSYTGWAVYIDGSSVALGTAENKLSISGNSTTGEPVRIGARPDGSVYYQGSLDEVAIYGTVLSPARVAAHYAAGTGGGGGQALTAEFTDSVGLADVAVRDVSKTFRDLGSSLRDGGGNNLLGIESSFETDTNLDGYADGWFNQAYAGADIATVTSGSLVPTMSGGAGTYAQSVYASAPSGGPVRMISGPAITYAGAYKMFISIRVRNSGASTVQAALAVVGFLNNGTPSGDFTPTSYTSIAAGVVTTHTWTVTVDPATAYVRPMVGIGPTYAGTVEFDSVIVTEGTAAPLAYDYFDPANRILLIRGPVDLSDSAGITDSHSYSLVGQALTFSATDSMGVTDLPVEALSKAAPDTVGITDLVTESLTKAAPDTVGITDLVTEVVNKSVPDTVGLTDLVVQSLGVDRSDTVGITDLVQADKALGVDRQDVIGATDLAVDDLSSIRSETTGIADSITKSLARTSTDTTGIADAVVEDVGTGRGDSTGITDSVVITGDYTRTSADTAGITDTIEYAKSAPGLYTEPVGLTDSVILMAAYIRSYSDTENLTDLSTKLLARPLSDTSGVSESSVKVLAKARSDIFGLTDTVSAIKAGIGRPKVWTGSAHVAKPGKVWDGTGWPEKPWRTWNGSAWMPEAAPAFTPDSIPGLAIWLDASVLSLVDGALVVTWPDLSGNGCDAVNSVADATKPVYRASAAPNGKPGVKFTGPSQFLDIRGLGTWLSGRSTYSLVVVMQETSNLSNWPVIMCAPTNAIWQWLVEYDATTKGVYWGHYNGRWRIYDAKVQVGEWMMLEWVLPDGQPQHFYKNGVEPVIAQTSSGGDMLPSVPTGIGPDVRLGCYYNNNLGINGHVSEVLLYDHALSDAERQQVEGYMRTKWGL